jgi:hypothetical protein
VRTWADNNLELFDWLEKHGVKWDSYRGAPDRLDRNRTRLNVVRWPDEPTTPARGSGFVRPLEKTARQMGVEILLHQQMTKIHRESPLAGRVTGIATIEVDDWYRPKTRTMNIRARKGIIIATGGSAGNRVFRTMFDVRRAGVGDHDAGAGAEEFDYSANNMISYCKAFAKEGCTRA